MLVAILLHNIRSAHNVGAIFRTADAAGVSRVYLSGYTPTPTDRFGRPQKEIAKTALGAEKTIPWQYARTPARFIKQFSARGGSASGGRKEKWQIVGIEQDMQAQDYRSFKIRRPTLFIFGNEVRGISKEMRLRCDTLLEIPMHGRKESLNVSVAAGIILFSAI